MPRSHRILEIFQHAQSGPSDWTIQDGRITVKISHTFRPIRDVYSIQTEFNKYSKNITLSFTVNGRIGRGGSEETTEEQRHSLTTCISTIFAIVDYFMKRYPVESISFFSSDYHAGRLGMYARIAQRFAKQYRGVVDDDNDVPGVHFIHFPSRPGLNRRM